MRNRIISGLAKQLIVTEAGRKSGTMLTAQAALEEEIYMQYRFYFYEKVKAVIN